MHMHARKVVRMSLRSVHALSSLAHTSQSEKKQGTHTPLTQAQLAALASRNSSVMRYVSIRCL